MAVPFAVGCDSDSDHDTSVSTKYDMIRTDCPDGQYSSEFIDQSLRKLVIQGYAYDEDACIAHDQVVATVSEVLPRLRKAIDEYNAVLDSNKSKIDEFIRTNYLSVANPQQRLLKQLKDNCAGSIESLKLRYPVLPSDFYHLQADEQGRYVASPLVGDASEVVKKIEMAYVDWKESLPGGLWLDMDADSPVYGKRGSVSLIAELERVYHEAWTQAYEGVKPEFVYDYYDAIGQVCGSGESPTAIINNAPREYLPPPPPVEIPEEPKNPSGGPN